ncbi:uncharacterized protein I303_105066 [Kwoniella dejecticola CBS 10117]|uniref:Beta-lactamase-related domain-containing protein n=1 Tax=Kwoniella dejecticola CBS 10117 TaxID=1296121 RepID=A0A1A6A3J4_9TREE|nr:uncharacterized protein I303_05488 [Kwoniella dejecticola CBS 10117]OBR84629.1 hypothetical protein I303_05488 [Kwoniella dejecticola CBS 10117]
MISTHAEQKAHTVLPDPLLVEISKLCGAYGVLGCHLVIVKDDVDVRVASTLGKIKSKGKDALRVGQELCPLGASAQLITLLAISEAFMLTEHKITDPIKGYLPELQMSEKDVADKITCVDLITHMSGLPRLSGIPDKDINADNVISKLGAIKPEHPFRSTYYPTNIAGPILEALIKHLTNQNVPAWIDDCIFQKYAMQSSQVARDGNRGNVILSNGRDILQFVAGLPHASIYEQLFTIQAENIDYPLNSPPQLAAGCFGLVKTSYNGKDTYENWSLEMGTASCL